MAQRCYDLAVHHIAACVNGPSKTVVIVPQDYLGMKWSLMVYRRCSVYTGILLHNKHTF